MLKSPLSTRLKAVLKSAPTTLTRAPPPVERYVVPKGPTQCLGLPDDFARIAIVNCLIASYYLGTGDTKGSIAVSEFTTETNGMPPIQSSSPKPKAPSREQVQIEVDTIMREVEEKRASLRRTADQQQLHDAMLSAIFKSVFEDTVPDSAVGIYSSGEKDCTGCDIPKIIDFRSLPTGVQDDLMKAEILPTMWPQYRISGCERMFHYCLMTVTTLFEASCHNLSQAGIDNMYPPAIDRKHRNWINSLMSTPGGPQEVVDQLILVAFECAISILREAGSPVKFVINFNAYQLDLFLFIESRTWALVAFLRSSLAG